MKKAKRTFTTLLAPTSLLAAAVVLLGLAAGCATPPKPRELEAFEALRESLPTRPTRRRSRPT